GGDEVGGLGGGDVFEHHLQGREVARHLGEHPVDEHGLAVENVHCGIGDLAVHQQRHADRLHALQHGIDLGNVGDAVGRVGGGVGGIELGGGEHLLLEPAR